MRSALENQHDIPSKESDSSSSTRSQLLCARSQLIQVHEIIKNVENHVDNQSSGRHKSRPNHRPITTYSPPQETFAQESEWGRQSSISFGKSDSALTNSMVVTSHLTSTSREAKSKSSDLNTLKSEIHRLWSEQEKLKAKRASLSEQADALNEGYEMKPELINEVVEDRRVSNQSEVHLTKNIYVRKDKASLPVISGANFPNDGNSQTRSRVYTKPYHDSVSIEPLGSSRRVRSDETSDACMPRENELISSLRTNKSSRELIPRKVSFVEFDESIKIYNPERTSPDPEADINVTRQISTQTTHTSLVEEFPETTKLHSNQTQHTSPVEEYQGADDQSVLSLFPINDIEFKSVPDKIMARIEPRLNKACPKADSEFPVADIEVRNEVATEHETNKINCSNHGILLKNTDKTFVKSLDRPESRRHSSMYPRTETSFSRRSSDPAHGSARKLELPLKQVLMKSLDRPAPRKSSPEDESSSMFSRRNSFMTRGSTRNLELPPTFSRRNSDMMHTSARKPEVKLKQGRMWNVKEGLIK